MARYSEIDVLTLDDVQEMNFLLDFQEEVERRESERSSSKMRK